MCKVNQTPFIYALARCASFPRTPTVIFRVTAAKRPFLACGDPNPGFGSPQTLDYGAAETLLRTAKARVGPRPSTFRYPQVSRPARHCLIQQHRNTHGTRTSLLSHSVTPAGQDRALGRAFCRESCERPCLGVHAGRPAWFRWHPFRLSRGQGQRDRLRLCQVRL